MFGYIVPDRPELKVKEDELYKAYYCGLCHSIKHNIGNLPRLSLTYDLAFLAMLFSGIKGDTENILQKRCVASPVRKKLLVEQTDILTYCAEMNSLLSYYKLKDNIRDDKNPLFFPILVIYKLKVNKLLKKYSSKSDIIEKEISRLTKMEKENEKDIDILSGIFGKIIEEIFTYHEFGEDTVRILKWMGFNLGKWIYVIDAFDDIRKDIEKKRFNPFVTEGQGYEETQERQRERVKKYLFTCLEEVSAAFEILELRENRSILENIIYSGLLKKTCERCDKHEKPL